MKRVLVFSDSRWRDAFGDALLVKHLAKKHFAVVCSYDLWQDALRLFKPHVILLNHLHGARNRLIANHVRRQGGCVCVLPTEGKITSQYMDDRFQEQLDSPDMHYLYAWNDLVVHPKVIVTGHPRFSIYHPEFSHLIDSRDIMCAKYGLDSTRPIIAIASIFPQAKFSYHSIKFNEDDWRDLGLSKYPGRESPYQYAATEYEQLNKFKLWVKLLVDAHPEYQYVLEPHPMEDRAPWEGFCHENKIVLIRQEYIFNLLSVADCFVTRIGCTTVQDAWLMGKPTLRAFIYQNPDIPTFEEASIGHVAYGSTELIDKFPDILQPVTEEEGAARKQYLKKYGYDKSQNSVPTIVAHIDSIIGGITVIEDPTIPDLMEFNKRLANHTNLHMLANPVDVHLGKSVTQGVISEWQNSIMIGKN